MHGDCVNQPVRTVALHLALGAMILRALLPAGFMPASPSSGAFISVCTTGGLIRLAADESGAPSNGKAPKDDSGKRHELCPFAAAAVSKALLTASGAELALLQPDVTRALALSRDRATSRNTHRPQSSRGPPIV